MRPETQDTSFLWDDFMLKVNTELLNNLGNFVNRALSFVEKFFDCVVPEMELSGVEEELLEKVDRDLQEYIKNCEEVWWYIGKVCLHKFIGAKNLNA